MLKKSASVAVAFSEFKKRVFWTPLRENQGNSAFQMIQISTSVTLVRGQKSRSDFFNKIDPQRTFKCPQGGKPADTIQPEGDAYPVRSTATFPAALVLAKSGSALPIR